jgi:hypothetical protein
LVLRVRNSAGAGTCRHFVTTFQAKQFAGTEFVYPGDFLPAIAASAQFDLDAGSERIVKARWPRELVPRAGSHPCLLASVLARNDRPTAGLHVWEHANLAQKNLTVVDLEPNWFIIIPLVLRTVWPRRMQYLLEVWRDRALRKYDVALIGAPDELFGSERVRRTRLELDVPAPARGSDRLECGGDPAARLRPARSLLTSEHPELIAQTFGAASRVAFPAGLVGRIPIELASGGQHVVGVLIAVPRDARPGTVFTTHLAQRQARTRQLTGGIAVEVHVERGPILKVRR